MWIRPCPRRTSRSTSNQAVGRNGSVHGPAPGKGAEQGSPGQDVHERPAGCERGQTGEVSQVNRRVAISPHKALTCTNGTIDGRSAIWNSQADRRKCGSYPEMSSEEINGNLPKPTSSDADCKTALVVSKRSSCVQAVIRRLWRTQNLLKTHVSVLPPTLRRCRTRLNR